MTKARARERAKAKALDKVRKRLANADQPAQAVRPGHFDPGTGNAKGPGMNANTKSQGATKRGAARSG